MSKVRTKNNGKPYHSKDWTEKEKELFIEGLNLYGRNCTNISMHMKTKSNVQVKHYLDILA